jgi:anti-sigma B factor antagonist
MACEIGLQITVEEDAAVVVFKSASLCDVDGINNATDRIKEYIDQKRPKRLIFDFDGVKFFSSQVLGLLLNIRAKLSEYNGEVVISAINPQLYRVFKITNLDKVFQFFPDRRDALKMTSAD